MIYLGDSYKLLEKIEDDSIDLIATDPPYEMMTQGGGSINRIKKLDESLEDIEEIVNGYDIEEYSKQFLRVLKTPNLYFWCSKAQIPKYLEVYRDLKFDILCWFKTNALPTYSNKYLSDVEYLLYFRKGNVCHPESYEDAHTFYIAPLNQKDKKLYNHPTIKPLDITERIIRNSSHEGDTVLDPFMGSGTTGVACKNLKRNFIGMEINEKYFDIAKERIGDERIEKSHIVKNKQLSFW